MPAQLSGRLFSRGVVRVTGVDALNFLQALVTSDLRTTSASASVYTNFLNSRGRVEFDALLHARRDGGIDVDVARAGAARLVRHLRMFALREKVCVEDVSEECFVWAACGGPRGEGGGGGGGGGERLREDPRLPGLGLRGLVRAAEMEKEMAARVDGEMDAVLSGVRTVLGVPEGRDFEGGARLPLEMGLERLRGVSFDKGCYLGQELTARTFHTGTVRKHVAPFVAVSPDAAEVVSVKIRALLLELRDRARGDAAAALRLADAIGGELVCGDGGTGAEGTVQPGEDVMVDGKKRPVGVVSSTFRNLGLAVLRVEDAFPLAQPGAPPPVVGRPLLLAGGQTIIPWRPTYLNAE